MHSLLKQQLQRLGLVDSSPPDPKTWVALQELLNQTYTDADQSRDQWKEAYVALREEREKIAGSFELLRQSSADIIRNERDKLHAMIRSLGEGLCSLNENGCLLFMNPEAETLIGWEEVDIRGQLILDWLMPSAVEQTTTDELFAQLRQGIAIRQQEAYFLHKNGRQMAVSFILDPIMRDDRFAGAVLAFRDMRSYKEAEFLRERQLQETLMLNQVIAATTSTLELTDILNTVCAEVARFLNLPQAAFALLNETKDHLKIVAEYLGEGDISALGEIIPIENNPATQQVLNTKRPIYIADAQNDPRQVPVQNIARRRGTRSMLIVPLLVREQVLGTLGLNSTHERGFEENEIQLIQNVASAVTQALENAQLYTAVQQELAERRAAEQALAQARDKAREASRLKSELVAKVSHELRSPLAAIVGFTEMVQLGVYGSVSDEQKDILGNILQSADGLVVLVNDLLDVAQIEAGKLTITYHPFEPRELIGRMESTMTVLADRKGLELHTEIDPNLPQTLFGDGDRIHQVLINLVSNAIKFTAEGHVQVKLHLLNGTQWALSVKDTGKGIPADMHDMIFDQFQQVRFSPTREEGGIGLGLSIVKQLVTTMGGRIQLESQVNKGSLFIVTLPLALPGSTTQQPIG